MAPLRSPSTRRRGPLRAAACLLFAVLLAAAPALAQVSDADRDAARALAQQGQDALDVRDYATALTRFTRAEAIIHVPTLLLGQARAQVGLGHLVAAQALYAGILRVGVTPGAPAPFTKALRDARKELDALSPRIPTLVITVRGAPAPTVTIDGAPATALGARAPVDPGKHVVRAEAAGCTPAEVTVTVGERKSEAVTLDLQPGPVGGASPPAPVEAPGSSGGGSTLKMLGIISLAAGGAGLVVGVATGVVALGKHADLAKVCPANGCHDHTADIAGYHVMSTTSTVGVVAGGVLAAAGVALLIVAPRATRPADAWLAPVLGPGYAGVAGRF
jgi:hypothetical protein